MSCVHSRMSCDHSRTGCVHSTYASRRWRLHCAFTAHLLRNVCSAIARRFFWTCSKFDGACSARGVCLAHLGDSTAYVWRTQSVNEDPRAYVAYLPRISYFFRTPCQRSSIAGQWNRGITCVHFLNTMEMKSEIARKFPFRRNFFFSFKFRRKGRCYCCVTHSRDGLELWRHSSWLLLECY